MFAIVARKLATHHHQLSAEGVKIHTVRVENCIVHLLTRGRRADRIGALYIPSLGIVSVFRLLDVVAYPRSKVVVTASEHLRPVFLTANHTEKSITGIVLE